MPRPHTSELFIWRHFQLRVPEDWEMLRFEKALTQGRCTFADRYQHRLEFSWRMTTAEPDIPRMLRDEQSTLLRNPEAGGMRDVQVAGWSGMTATLGNEATSRFIRFFPGEGCVVELVFLWSNAREANLERAVLRSLREEAADSDGLRRWRAYGMDMLVTDALPLRDCHVEPASALMTFGSAAESKREERFERYGLLPERFRAPTADWLTKRLPQQVVAEPVQESVLTAHSVFAIRGVWYRDFFRRTIRRGMPYQTTAWVCPSDGRLYCETLTGTVPPGGPPSSAARLLCCSDFEAALSSR